MNYISRFYLNIFLLQANIGLRVAQTVLAQEGTEHSWSLEGVTWELNMNVERWTMPWRHRCLPG